MFVYRLWNYSLGHYQYYEGGTELVELRSKSKVRRYIELNKGDYRVDLINLSKGIISKGITL